MNIRSTIRSVLAIGILLVFSLSIMPKVYLHSLFANHHDTPVKVVQTGQDQIAANGFSCEINDNVATSPFTGQLIFPDLQPAPLFPTATTQHLISNLRMQAVAIRDQRGPPAMI